MEKWLVNFCILRYSFVETRVFRYARKTSYEWRNGILCQQLTSKSTVFSVYYKKSLMFPSQYA